MIKKIEILVINILDRFIGIDVTEIKRIIPDISSEKEKKLIKKYKEQKKYYQLGDFFNINKDINYNTIIVIEDEDENKNENKNENENEILIATPTLSNVITVELSNISIVPDYIKKKQNPFFLWGFTKDEDRIISLITLSFFSKQGVQYGKK